MKRKEMNNGANCVEFNLMNTDRFERCLYVKFCYADMFKNEFIKFMWNYIYQLKNEDKDFDWALNKIEVQPKNAEKVVNKEERKEELKKAYRIIRDKAKQEKILNKYDRTKEFRKQYTKKYNIFLADDEKDYLCDDVMKAFEDYFYGKGKKVVEKAIGTNTSSIRHKPMYARKKDGSISTIAQGSAKIYFKNGKAYYEIWDLRTESLKHIFDVWDEEEQVFTTKSGNIPNHKRVSFEIYCKETDKLQKQLMSNEYLGYTKLIKYWKKGKARYRVQINFEKLSPVIKEINNEKYKIGIDYGTETVAIVREDGFQEIIELTPNTPRITDRIKELDIYMNNSRMAMNPQMYNENGTRKSNKELKELGIVEVYSNRYKKARAERRECYRLLKEKRKLNNFITAKYIFQLGDEFITENNSFKAWGMKRCRMAEKTMDKYGKGQRKNDYTKQIHDRAVGSVDARIKSLAEQKELSYNKVSNFDCSTYNHLSDANNMFLQLNHRLVVFDNSDIPSEYKDVTETFDKTIERICDSDGNSYILQRDLYAASKMLFLHSHIEKREKDGKKYDVTVWEFDKEGYTKFFNEIFYPEHKKYIKKLVKEKNLNLDETINGTILGY